MRDLVVIPTYCEQKTLPGIIKRLHIVSPTTSILVVDDHSPDGTGVWAREQAEGACWLHVINRDEKTGLGTAYLDGFRWGIEHEFGFIGQMDADGSHLPEEYPRLKARIDMPDQPDLVIGSRWVPGGGSGQWDPWRRVLSQTGNQYWKMMTGINISDITSGFRLYRAHKLAHILCQITEGGFGFQAEMTVTMMKAGRQVVEVPIHFVNRLDGESKIDASAARTQLTAATLAGIERLAFTVGRV